MLAVIFLGLLTFSAAKSTSTLLDYAPLHTTEVFTDHDSTYSIFRSYPKEKRTFNTVARGLQNSPDFRKIASQNNADPGQLFPIFEGSLQLGRTLKWESHCFSSNVGQLTAVNENGFTFQVESAQPKSSGLCADVYVMATSERFFLHVYTRAMTHKGRVEKWESPQERLDILDNGFRVFHFPAGIIAEIGHALEWIEMFIGKRSEEATRDFVEQSLHWNLRERKPVMHNIDPALIESGDVFFLFALEGTDLGIILWSGSRAVHTAVALHYPDGLYILESTDHSDNPRGVPPPPWGIKRTPWAKWISDYSYYNYSVSWAKPIRNKPFDEQAARDYFATIEGLPFGYESYAFTAADHANAFPPPITNETLLTVIAILDALGTQAYGQQLRDGLNKRFHEVWGVPEEKLCNSMRCVYELAVDLGITVTDVFVYPEQDSWLYDGQPSIVCDVLIMRMLCVGGVLDFCDQINTSEFTPRDVYELKIWNTTWEQPAPCHEFSFPYCQVAGRWVMELREFSTIPWYPHMNEHCESRAPDFTRYPPGC